MDSRVEMSINITGSQVRAARALLGWDRQQCADRCGIGLATLARIERGVSVLDRTVADMVRVFREAGLEFFNDERGLGVAIRHQGS